MPASRSRTERWRDCLTQIAERGGGLEFSIASPETGADLVWRSRVTSISEHDIVLERPVTMGRAIHLQAGLDLVCVMAVGQNRWMFRSQTLPPTGPGTLRLAMPSAVERCARRNFLRVSTIELRPPLVECWPLLDHGSVTLAEIANRTLVSELESRPATPADDSQILPEVGPGFRALLMNIGGGGVGLMIERADTAALEHARAFWLRIDLRPQVAAPLAMCTRLAHTHIDSEQNTYAGLSFDFPAGTAHRDFVVEQICRYVAKLQAGLRAA